MERFTLNQWALKVDGKDVALFTPPCTTEQAMAVAVATFGFQAVEMLVDEGQFKQSLSGPQLHIADPRNCQDCGAYLVHDERCPRAESQGARLRDAAGKDTEAIS